MASTRYRLMMVTMVAKTTGFSASFKNAESFGSKVFMGTTIPEPNSVRCVDTHWVRLGVDRAPAWKIKQDYKNDNLGCSNYCCMKYPQTMF